MEGELESGRKKASKGGEYKKGIKEVELKCGKEKGKGDGGLVDGRGRKGIGRGGEQKVRKR